MPQNIEKWDFYELTIDAEVIDNPFTDVVFKADFTHNHRTVTVDGFYDGEDSFKLRFMPDMDGRWQFTTKSNIPALDGHQGEINCVPPGEGNHGIVRVIDNYHFAYADGTPYHPVGTTCYVWNHQGDDLEAQTLATLETAPFNKMRLCVFPKRYAYNQNEPPCYPFEGDVKQWDFTRFNPDFFRRLEQQILALQERGIEADLILFHPYDSGAWDFDKLPPEVNDRYLRYLVARLSAFRNVWWSFANEYDLMANRTLADWDHYIQLVQDSDPYHHLRSIHNCFTFYDHSNPAISHCSIQSHDVVKTTTWLEQYRKPVVIDECGYEGDINYPWGSMSAQQMVELFWQGFTVGGYVGHGETYWNEEEILWWSKGGTLRGASAERIAFLRQIIEAVPAPGLFPLTDRNIFPDGAYKGMVAGHHGEDYFLLYCSQHQPRFRYVTLPEGHYRIDIIDTWNMTVDCFAEQATGHVRVELPSKPYIAIRIERI